MSVKYNGTTYYYVTNLQGDVVGIVNQSGNKIVSYAYDAWGNILTTTGSSANTLGKYNPLRYRGYVFDRETGFYYLQSRYYDPEIGRFINADALVSTGQGILGHNMFAYCSNAPINYVDDTGHIPRSLAQSEVMSYGSSNGNIITVYFPSPKLFETGTIIIGGNVSGYTGKGGGASLGVAIDSSADAALVASGSWGAGTVSEGVAAFFTYSTAPDIERALGRSEYVGCSVCVLGISIGVDYAISNDTETGKPYHSYTILIGGKASTPFETHGGVSYMIDIVN